MAKKKERREWSDDDKRKVLEKIDTIKASGGRVQDYLDEQGLYTSMISRWRGNLGWKGSTAKATRSTTTSTRRTPRKARTTTANGSGALVALAEENETLRAALIEVRGQLEEVANG